MGNRAVVLTDLNTLDRAADLRRGGRVTRFRQRLGDPFRRRLDVVGAVGDTGQDGVDAAPGELLHRLLTADLAQLADRGRGQVVVGVLELGPAGGRQPVALGGPAAADLLPRRRGVGLGVTCLDEGVEVTAHPGGGEAQPVSDLGGGDRPRLQQQPHDGAARLTVMHDRARGGHRIDVGRDFHNTSVTQFLGRCPARAPSAAPTPVCPAVRVLWWQPANTR